MKKAIKIICLVLAATLMCASLAACSDPLKSTKEDMKTVCKVGEFEVPYELYRYLVMTYKDTIPEGTEITAEIEEQIKYNVDAALCDMYAIFTVTREHGLTADNEAVAAAIDAEVKKQMDGFAETELYLEALTGQYMTHNVLRQMTEKQILSDELYYKLMDDGTLINNEEEMKEYIYGDGFIRVKQVLIVGETARENYTGTYFLTGEEHTDAEAKAIAESVREKALAGEDFDKLVEKYGEEIYMVKNTDGYYVCEGMWEDANWKAASELKVGEISQVTESLSGYSVFLRCEKEDSYIDKKYDTLKKNYYDANFTSILARKSAELKVEYTEEFSGISLKDMK